MLSMAWAVSLGVSVDSPTGSGPTRHRPLRLLGSALAWAPCAHILPSSVPFHSHHAPSVLGQPLLPGPLQIQRISPNWWAKRLCYNRAKAALIPDSPLQTAGPSNAVARSPACGVSCCQQGHQCGGAVAGAGAEAVCVMSSRLLPEQAGAPLQEQSGVQPFCGTRQARSTRNAPGAPAQVPQEPFFLSTGKLETCWQDLQT